jgi:HAD superfamily hydrolase (TIGR01509 family)
MNKKLDTVIFDFDGVLFDTEEINYHANELTFQQHGLSFSRQEYAQLWIEEGLDMEDIISRYGIKTTPAQLREVKNRFFLEVIEVTPLPFIVGIRKSIEKLISNGYKIAIASSNFRRNIETVLRNANAEFSFDVIVGREDIDNPKPHPEVFLRCLELLNSSAEESVVIEDAPKGIISANRGGIKKVIAIPNYWTKNGDFSNASLILSSAEKLCDSIIKLEK